MALGQGEDRYLVQVAMSRRLTGWATLVLAWTILLAVLYPLVGSGLLHVDGFRRNAMNGMGSNDDLSPFFLGLSLSPLLMVRPVNWRQSPQL